MSDFGIFENQPAHLLSYVLERVPYNDLISLALSSKLWHSIIKKHVESPRFKKDILQSKNTFDIGKLIATMSEANDFQMIQQFLKNRWENEKDYDALGDAIRGFCTNSEEKMRANVKQLFYFTWSLVDHLDELVKKVDEEFDGEEGVDDFDELIAGRRRIELRRQLHSLFWKDAESEYKGFIFIQFIEKFGHLAGARQTLKLYNVLRILLNPTRIDINEEYVWIINFLNKDEMIDPLDVTLLKPFADAFKALQRVSSTAGDNETNVGIFREIAINYFHTSQVVVILSLEPSLLMWYIHDFSREASYFNAHVLLEMTMTMREGNYGSLEDLKSALNDWKNHAYYRFNGNGHLMELHREIGFAMMHYCTYGTVPHLGVFDNEYTKCLDIFGLGTEDSEDSKQFSSLEN